jgi:hypothetical protein
MSLPRRQRPRNLRTALGSMIWRPSCAAKRRFYERNLISAFWCEDIGIFALALDGSKTPCRVRTSNAGHALFTGIATPERAARVAEALVGPASFSGWGIRTVASSEARFNPISYHNGSIWPHDNAIIVLGFARYGFLSLAAQVFSAMVEAAAYQDLPVLRVHPQTAPRATAYPAPARRKRGPLQHLLPFWPHVSEWSLTTRSILFAFVILLCPAFWITSF